MCPDSLHLLTIPKYMMFVENEEYIECILPCTLKSTETNLFQLMVKLHYHFSIAFLLKMLVVGRYKKELTEKSYDKILTVGKVLDEVRVGREDDNEVIAVAEHNDVLIGRGYDEELTVGRVYDET